jgi:hypothetical protein
VQPWFQTADFEAYNPPCGRASSAVIEASTQWWERHMSEEKANAFSIKDLMTVAPVAAIVLAAMYDFGAFNAVDKSLFTLFSWSDHIVFALEAVFPAIVIVAALGWSLSKFTFDTPLKYQPRGRLWFLVILFALLTLAIVLKAGGWDNAVMLWGLLGLITLCAMFLRVSLSGVIVAYSLGLVFGAYVLGYGNAYETLRLPGEQLLLTTNNQMHGRAFRSGERGLLFYDTTTKKMSFLLWSEVKRLETGITETP